MDRLFQALSATNFLNKSKEELEELYESFSFSLKEFKQNGRKTTKTKKKKTGKKVDSATAEVNRLMEEAKKLLEG